jgi:hypothetical protein
MTRITKRGSELASRLNPYIGTTMEILETCSLIARSAVTHDRIQETWTSVELSDRATERLERREAGIEHRISELVENLPATDDGPFKVTFEGDPRGYTVKIVTPDGREIGAY